MSKLTSKTLPYRSAQQQVAQLFAVLTKLAPKQLMLLYGDLLTEAEAIMLAKRLQIAHGLLSGRSYSTIQKQLGVTASTVAQIQKVLKTAGSGFRAASDTLTSLEQSKSVSKPKLEIKLPVVALPQQEKLFKNIFSRVFHSAI